MKWGSNNSKACKAGIADHVDLTKYLAFKHITAFPHIWLAWISTDLSMMCFNIPVGQMRSARIITFRHLKRGIDEQR